MATPDQRFATTHQLAAHYVAASILFSLQKHSGSNFLDKHEYYSIKRANAGHLDIAFQFLERLSPQFDWRLLRDCFIPSEIEFLYDMEIQACFAQEPSPNLVAALMNSGLRDWGCPDTPMCELLHSACLALLLGSYRQVNPNADRVEAADASRDFSELVIQYIAHLELFEKSTSAVTSSPHWHTLLQTRHHVGLALSYAPLLNKLNTLLFGDAESVFSSPTDGTEAHIDRKGNVITSGQEHAPYFERLTQSIKSQYATPEELPPRYVVDVGCGDGSLLQKIYTSCSKLSVANGEFTPIAVDLNKQALQEARRTLQGLGHFISGDVRDPASLREEIKKIGIDPDQEVLHVRSFLDHDRSFAHPSNLDAIVALECMPISGCYAARDGQRLPAHHVFQALVEHLQRWADVIGKHGLLLLEVHCRTDKASRNIQVGNWAYFQALQGFSGQQLVDGGAFCLAAAMAGLFSEPKYLRTFPDGQTDPSIVLHWFKVHRAYIRPASPNDYSRIRQLESACWKELAVSDETLISQLNSPLSTFVLCDKLSNEILACVMTQRVRDVALLAQAKWESLSLLSDSSGTTLQLISLSTSDAHQDAGYGGLLLDFILSYATVNGEVNDVAGVSRCRDFSGTSLSEYNQYVRSVDSRGLPVDPILRMHAIRGASIRDIVEEYRHADNRNLGCGVVVHYTLDSRHDRRRPEIANAATQIGYLAEIEVTIKNILGDDRSAFYSPDCALRDIGLDSLDLQDLASTLSDHCSRVIRVDDFFRYPTARLLSEYLSGSTDRDQHSWEGSQSEQHPIVVSVSDDYRLPMDDALVAIVGVGMRLPGDSNTPESFWEFLQRGSSGIIDLPDDRWGEVEWREPVARLRRAGFVRDIDCFDHAFFGISPREARLMDPQQRMLLQSTWHALQDAAIDIPSLSGTATGVWVGISSNDYCRHVFRDIDGIEAHSSTGTAFSTAAGRLSYFFGLNGPCCSIDTACSSSLVAVHNACVSLSTHECNLAIAAGVNLIFPEFSVSFSKAGMLSPRFACRTFDAAADGYVRGEGCGVVILKRLSDAVADADPIYAVIRGTVTNHCGRSNGLTAPSMSAQESLFRQVLLKSGATGSEIGFVEAHGTGTSLGDPIEANALLNVLRQDNGSPLVVGALKTNIGHLEAAAGVASLIKTALCITHERIPSNRNFEALNPLIGKPQLFNVPLANQAFPNSENGHQSLAMVNSFGFGGTNACALLAQAPTASRRGANPNQQLHEFRQTRSWYPSRRLQPRPASLADTNLTFSEQDAGGFFSCEFSLSGAVLHHFRQHRIRSRPILPAATYIALLIEIGHLLRGHILWEIRDAEILSAVPLSDSDSFCITSTIRERDKHTFDVECAYTRGDNGNRKHACFRATLCEETNRDFGLTREQLIDTSADDSSELSSLQLYEQLAECGYNYGPHFQRVKCCSRQDGTITARLKQCDELPQIQLPNRLCDIAAIFDSTLHIAVNTFEGQRVAVPTGWQSFRLVRDYRLATTCLMIPQSALDGTQAESVDVILKTADDRQVGSWTGVRLESLQIGQSVENSSEVQLNEEPSKSGVVDAEFADVLRALQKKAKEILMLDEQDDLNVDTPLSSTGMDSIMYVEFALAVEEMYHISIESKAFESLRTLVDLANWVLELQRCGVQR